jgi:hypothetical protein
MLSRETLEEYRRMSLGEKITLTLQMIRESTLFLLEGPTNIVQRRFELLRRENDLRNQRMLQAIARTRKQT